MSEIDEIKERYKRRKNLPEKSWYSYFNSGNLFIIQKRQREILKLLDKYRMHSLTDKKILDIGCGNGGSLRDFVQWGARPENLFGVDLIEEKIEGAKKVNPNINFICGNAEKLDFPDKTFDIVLQFTCFSSIFSSEMKNKIAKEMLRVLKDEGIILWYD